VVKAAVAEWKRQRREVFVPLTYRPGDLAEVDFFEVLIDVDGTRRKAWLFLMRLMYSGRDFAWIYERQDQISFLDGHVRAFAHFEGYRLASRTTICGPPSCGFWSVGRGR
jgi:transposase